MKAKRATHDRARFAALRATSELAGWSERDLIGLLSRFDEVLLPAGAWVAVEGQPCEEFVIVVEGRLRAGSRTLGPGESVGWDAMWERGPNETTVVAESEARLLVMSYFQFGAIKALAS